VNRRYGSQHLGVLNEPAQTAHPERGTSITIGPHNLEHVIPRQGHVIERHPVIPVDAGFKCVKCGRVEDSARCLVENCDYKDKCYVLWFKRKLAGVDEAELLKTEVKLKLRTLKQALEEGGVEEASRIADQLLKTVASGV
jgi:hypothetical protein